MKKRLVVSFVFGVIILMSLVSAGWFSDLFKKDVGLSPGEQTITLLPDKLNLISFYVLPENKSVVNVFSDIVDDLELVQNEEGGVYIPANVVFPGHPGSNTIGELDAREAYQVKLRSGSLETDLVVGGELVGEGLETILVSSFRNWISFPYGSEKGVEDYFSCIEDELIEVQNDDGRRYNPEEEINEIGNLRPGRGYFVVVTEDGDFEYGKVCEAIVEKDLMASYEFEDNLFDSTNNGNDGSFAGTPGLGFVDDSKSGKALFLSTNANDYVDFGDKLSGLESTEGITWSGWIKTYAPNSQMALFNHEGAMPRITMWDNVFEFYVHETRETIKSDYNINWFKLIGNGWHHLAVVVEGVNVKLYVDGNEVKSGTLSTPFVTGGLNIGNGGGSSKDYGGRIDNVKIFNYALSESEIEGLAEECVLDDDCGEGEVCRGGECVVPEPLIDEQITCVFSNSETLQTCSTNDEKFECLGIENCTINVLEEQDTVLTWESSCSGYQQTIVDGTTKIINFTCGHSCISITHNGPNKINLIIVSEGYTDYDSFDLDVTNFVNDIFLKIDPYKLLNQSFNIYKLRGNFYLGCGYNSPIDSKCNPENVSLLKDYCVLQGNQTDFIVLVDDPLANPGTCFNSYYNDTILPDFPFPLVRNSMMAHGRKGDHLMHEYVHCYGIDDEYFKDYIYPSNLLASSTNCDLEGCPKWCLEPTNTTVPCYDSILKFQICLEETHNYWSCLNNSIDYERYIFTCDIGSNCNEGVGCIYGCGSLNGYKELKYSLMGNARNSDDRKIVSPNTEDKIVELIRERTNLENLPLEIVNGLACENNFECSSNLCFEGECMGGNILQEFFRWLNKLF